MTLRHQAGKNSNMDLGSVATLAPIPMTPCPGMGCHTLPSRQTPLGLSTTPCDHLESYVAILELAAAQLDGVLWLWNAVDQMREIVSGSVAELWGITLPENPHEQIQTFSAVIDPAHRHAFSAAFAPDSGPVDLSIRIHHPQNGARWLRIRKVIPTRGDGSRQVGLTQDITEEVQRLTQEHQQQDLLKRADRLATLGILSASLVHDLNHSLNGINLAVGLLDQWIQSLHPVLVQASAAPGAPAFCGTSLPEITTQMPILIGGIQDTVRRMVAMQSHMRRYTKGTALPPEDLEVAEVVRDVVALVRPYLDRAVVRCVLDLPGDGLHLRSQRIGLEQVLTNLITNAAEALTGRGGTITIGARTGMPEPRELLLWVADDGPGLRPEDQVRLGMDFFTTRHDGTGLGWVIIRRVVLELGGQVTLTSAVGTGTRVEVRLPLDPPESLSRPPSGEVLRPALEPRS